MLKKLSSFDKIMDIESQRFDFKSQTVNRPMCFSLVRDEIEQLMDDNGDMPDIYLTEKKMRMDSLSYSGDQTVTGYRLSWSTICIESSISSFFTSIFSKALINILALQEVPHKH